MSAFVIAKESSSDRHKLENFIKKNFREAYDSKVESFLELLIGFKDHKQGHVHSAVGIGADSAKPFFLEQYLDQPIEEKASSLFNCQCLRKHFAEIGNLSSIDKMQTFLLFIIVSYSLVLAKFRYLVFTVTDFLANSLKKMGLDIRTIAQANKNKVANAIDWGSYYEHTPQIYILDVRSAYNSKIYTANIKQLIKSFSKEIKQLVIKLKQYRD